jgi:hypothetical protein
MNIGFKNSVVNVLAIAAAFVGSAASAYAELPASCRYSCSPQCMNELTRLEAEIASFKSYNCYGNHPNPGPGPGPGPNPPYPPYDDNDRVEIYKSDTCSGSLVAVVDSRTDCERLGNDSAWAVKINGRCMDIQDTTLTKACQAFSGGMRGVKFYHSDTCNGSLLGTVGRRSDCSRFADVVNNNSVWAVEVNGQCQDIADMNPKDACEAFKGGDRGGVKFFHSDTCRGGLVAIVNNPADCRKLSPSMPSVWAIEVNGQCQDINDMSFVDACARFANF